MSAGTLYIDGRRACARAVGACFIEPRRPRARRPALAFQDPPGV